MKVQTTSVEETKKCAQRLAHELILECGKGSHRKKALTVGLYGDLGSGKTSFVQGLAEALGVEDKVSSPTFVIQKIYTLKKDLPFEKLIHIDTYRFEHEKEAKDIQWDKYTDDKKNLIVVEWASKIETVMPEDAKKIYFTFVDQNTREIEW